jgi:hypothetical protein
MPRTVAIGEERLYSYATTVVARAAPAAALDVSMDETSLNQALCVRPEFAGECAYRGERSPRMQFPLGLAGRRSLFHQYQPRRRISASTRPDSKTAHVHFDGIRLRTGGTTVAGSRFN